MINNVNFAIGIVFLVILSILDFWTFDKEKGFIPASLTTIFLIATFILGSMDDPLLVIQAGIAGLLFGILFTDLDLWGGFADLKIFIGCSMLMPSFIGIAYFALVLTIVSFVFKFMVKKLLTQGREWQIPFIPVIMIAFAIASFL